MTRALSIEAMRPEDWPRVRDIYESGVATGHATFETRAPEWPVWDASHMAACRLVARAGGEVWGWAALSPVSSRCVYAGVAETSVYVDPARRGEGVGSSLLEALAEASEEAGLWTLQAGVFPENEASVRVHLKAGFRVVGVRRRLGKLNGVWRDVLLLERRSEVLGVD